MSLETWKAEFYPTDAKDCPPEQAIAHSLRKWEGLTVESLVKHELHFNQSQRYIYDSQAPATKLGVSDQTCALCQCYYDNAADFDSACVTCPLAKHNGVRCYAKNEAGVNLFIDSIKHPIHSIIMITALKETLKANS